MIKISSKKLAELRTHYLEGRDADPDNVIEAFALNGQEELEAYLEGLRIKYPDDFPPLASDEPEADYTYFLKADTGLLQELELVRNKNGVLVFAPKVPKDLITLMIKGKPVEVDLIQLAKYPGDSPHGVLNSKLIELAEIVRG